MRRWFHTHRWMSLVPLVLATACGAGDLETPPDPAVAADAVTLPTVDPVPEVLPAIVARVNTHNLTKEELERAVRSAEIQAGQALPTQFRDQVYRSVLDRLVSFHLLVQESETLSIVVDDAGVDARIETIRSNFPDDEAFQTQLDSWETTIDDLREETRRDLLVEGVLEAEVLPGINVDVETTREFYEQHAAEFTEGGGVEARHILIGFSPDASDQEKAEARKRADSLRLDVEAGVDFAELARTHSEDPGSAANGGDLGNVVRGQTVPTFEAALFALEPGDLSEVVETPFGFHVIQMVGREAERTVPFAEASVQIREFLVQQEQQARIAAFIEELKAKSDIEILI
ncbi:MAG: peptidylprolyl isomerase [Vicinamibacterales bacterium]|nr:peptidylprolyl isomerase [Vicinamibacterales bacterium]MDP7690302.1 peptidylprolyl isomerase [Vicinamibacterales bacterium]HJN43703.1 peptidylprolyl isomerase [Vicinamibacterales bacterium]